MRTTSILFSLAALAFAVAAAAQEPGPQPAPAPAPPTDAEVKAMFESACSSCHDTGFVGEHRKTHADWEWTVSQMISRGAELNPDEAAVLVDYLAKTYPAPETPPADKPPPT